MCVSVDSETVLNKTSNRFKVYGGVRVGEIQAATCHVGHGCLEKTTLQIGSLVVESQMVFMRNHSGGMGPLYFLGPQRNGA